LQFFGQAAKDKGVRVIRQFQNQSIWYISRRADRIPLLLIHVKARSDTIVLFSQLHRSLRITFEIDVLKSRDRTDRKDLPPYPETECILIKRCVFRHSRLSEAMISEIF